MSSDNGPKYLIATNLHPEHYFMNQRYPGMVKALDKSRVNFIDIFDFYNDPEKAQQLENLCFDALKLRSYFNRANIAKLNNLFLEHALSYDWDILCLCSMSHYGLYILPDTIRKLSQRGLVVGFFGDDEFNFKYNRFWPRLFDAVVAYTEKEVKLYQRWNPYTYLLPVGVDSEGLELADVRGTDVMFVGSPYGNRVEILTKVQQAGVNLKIYGSRRWAQYAALNGCYQGFLEAKDYWKVLSQAKIVLSLMEDLNGKPHINGKVFEATKVKAMALATYYPPFETTYGLQEGKDIVFYHSLEDLISKLKYYLEHLDEQQHIAENLRRKIVENFTYEKLYKSLFDNLDRQLEGSLSGTVFTERPPYEKFTILCLIGSKRDYYKTRSYWASKKNLTVIYLMNKALPVHPDVIPVRRFLHDIEVRSTDILNEFVLLACAGVEYDDVVFLLTLSYDRAGFLVDGLYYDSLVQGKRCSKGRHFFDLGSTVWRKDAFLAGAHTIMRGRSVHSVKLNKLSEFDLTYVPIPLNHISNQKLALKLRLFCWGRDLLHKKKPLFDKIRTF
jgi:glycosyltransferase involved in cell wall biosynthesis